MVWRILRSIRTPLLVLLAAGIVAAALNVAIGPIEAPGLPLPWVNPVEPAAPEFSVWQSSSKLLQGEILGIVVTPGPRQSYASVTGAVSGLPSVSGISFVHMEGAYRALVPVANSAAAGGYQIKIVVTDRLGRSAESAVSFEVKSRSFPTQRLTMPPSQTALLAEDKLAEDRAKVSAARANPEPQPLWEGAFGQPVQGRIATEYGQLRYVNGVLTSRHTGIDISAPEGTPVAAANSGRVVLTTALHASGNTVIIDHGLGIFTNYNHLSKILVKEGQKVTAGQIVGEVGSTGFSTGPHLHFTMTVGAVSTNPWVWFAANPKILVTTAGSGGR
ncbi:MAG: M23 family metallopeptidase [Bacillota bacterium]|nr:M23 family metallopeptidase [Bacillota bacterium]